MERNVPLMQSTMQHILDHPDDHMQQVWVCGTAACYAGRALLLNGMSLKEVATISWSPVSVALSACRALGITEHEAGTLFWCQNTVPMLELMTKDLANGDTLREPKDYAEATGVDYERLLAARRPLVNGLPPDDR